MKKINTDIVIHPGPLKTATTFLQQEIFPLLNNCNLMVKPLLTHVEIQPGKLNIISDEGLSGIHFKKSKYYCKPENRYIIIDRIYRMFPEARILVGKRKKESWLRSYWTQCILSGGLANNPISYDEFEKTLDKEWYNFSKYIGYLQSKFNDVYVYDFSDLKKNHEKFVKGICDYLHRPVPNYVNQKKMEKLSRNQIETIRLIDKMFKSYRIHNYVNKLIKIVRGYP